MYKDLDKRREMSRERMRKYRASLHPVTPDHVTPVTPEFVSGMGNWAKVRGSVVTPDKRVVIPASSRVGKTMPVKKDAWRLEKDAQMARFLKGVK